MPSNAKLIYVSPEGYFIVLNAHPTTFKNNANPPESTPTPNHASDLPISPVEEYWAIAEPNP